MDLQNMQTRLRKTFAYPSDTTTPSYSEEDEESETFPAYDEQEQEELIRSLAEQNRRRNAQFRIFLLCLPALSTIPYLILLGDGFVGLLSGERGRGEIWMALLALSSLFSTAWGLYSLPPGRTGIPGLDAWVSSSSSSSDSNTEFPPGPNARRRRRSATSASSWPQHRSPLEQYLPYLNIILCLLLVLTGFLGSTTTTSKNHHVGLAYLPAVVYVVVLVAEMLMGGVDPERELGALRYEFKGA